MIGPEKTVRELFETVINGKQYGRIPQYCSEDVTLHRPGERVTVGREAYKNHYRELHTVFPDFQADITDLVADPTRVAARFSVTGTHEGELFGLSPTGTRVEFSAQILFRLADGSIVEEFHQSDDRALRQQLGE